MVAKRPASNRSDRLTDSTKYCCASTGRASISTSRQLEPSRVREGPAGSTGVSTSLMRCARPRNCHNGPLAGHPGAGKAIARMEFTARLRLDDAVDAQVAGAHDV